MREVPQTLGSFQFEGGGWDDIGLAFPATALITQGCEYWLFVLGFALGAYSVRLTKYAIIMSASLGLVQEVLQQYFIFLQVGVLIGIFVKLTKL